MGSQASASPIKNEKSSGKAKKKKTSSLARQWIFDFSAFENVENIRLQVKNTTLKVVFFQSRVFNLAQFRFWCLLNPFLALIYNNLGPTLLCC